VEVIAAQYLAMIGALFFAATGVALFLGRWLARRVAAPIQSLSAAMGLVAQNADFSLRVPVAVDDELGRLIDSFNHLLAELQVKRRELDLTMDELVEAKDAAEAANRLKTQFLANMSHEIRTPLNGVLAMTQLMRTEAFDPIQLQRLGIVQQSGEALLAILNDILDVAKIESGFVTIERAPFELRALVQGAAAPFAEMAAAKGLDFACEVADEFPPWLMGDQGKLRQVLGNLASNAVKFTDEGQIRLSVEVSPEAPDRLRIEVADTGIGVDPDKLDLLFRKFSQVDSSNTRRFGGAGLGLAICKELVERMGGRIWMESAPGAGARVLIDLPAPAVEAPADVAPSKPAEPLLTPAQAEVDENLDGSPLRVLAAEDNLTNQLVLRAVLQSLPVDLTLVGDGRAAVEALDRGGFDLVLMDIQMPEMDGVAATREIRRREALAGRPRTPIVAVSANAMPFQVEEYLAAGMDAHLAKPIDVARLYALLSGGLGSDQLQGERIDAA
jgi:two-component system, sensor histidine kinase